MVRSLAARQLHTMTQTIDQIVEVLFARTELPPLEPGKKVYDQSLTKDIKGLKDDKFVIAGQCVLSNTGSA
jgi:hypothetical protein